MFSEIHFSENYFPNFTVFVCLSESWSTENTFRSTENTFQSKKNLAWFSGKCFPENLDGKHFPEVVKNLEMSLFADYIKFDPQTFAIYNLFWIFIFQFHLLKFNFYINFGPYFYNCYLLFSYHFFIEIFIYQIWSSFFLLLLILFEIIYEMLIIIIILIFSPFIF